MQGIIQNAVNRIKALLRREPIVKFGGSSNGDWLPPVFGPGDWSSGMMSDNSTGWYFDRRHDESREIRIKV